MENFEKKWPKDRIESLAGCIYHLYAAEMLKVAYGWAIADGVLRGRNNAGDLMGFVKKDVDMHRKLWRSCEQREGRRHGEQNREEMHRRGWRRWEALSKRLLHVCPACFPATPTMLVQKIR
eukprot:766963-Hanusia_phi.AAC.8